MRAFLAPHMLLTAPVAYAAALHSDKATAENALNRWIEALDPEQMEFAQHKLAGIALIRHRDRLAPHPLFGLLQNIQRQARLRAHLAERHLRAIVDGAEVPVVALGESHERLVLCPDRTSDLDHPALGLRLQDLADLTSRAEAQGYRMTAGPRRAPLRGVVTVLFSHTKAPLCLRLLAFDRLPPLAGPIAGLEPLQALTPQAHVRFICSRQAGILTRRDQIVFDFFRCRALGADQPLTWRNPPRFARGILGPGEPATRP